MRVATLRYSNFGNYIFSGALGLYDCGGRFYIKIATRKCHINAALEVSTEGIGGNNATAMPYS